MGWVHGKGLGVKKQGFVEPIKAKGNRGRAGFGIVKPAVQKPSQPTAPLTSQIKKMPAQSATRISVNGIGLSSTSLQKRSNYLSTYFRQFGAVEKIDFDCQGAIITYKNPAEADICLQQDQHTISGIDCEVKRAEASIPNVSIPQLFHPHSHRPLPPPTGIDNTAILSKTRIDVKAKKLQKQLNALRANISEVCGPISKILVPFVLSHGELSFDTSLAYGGRQEPKIPRYALGQNFVNVGGPILKNFVPSVLAHRELSFDTLLASGGGQERPIPTRSRQMPSGAITLISVVRSRKFQFSPPILIERNRLTYHTPLGACWIFLNNRIPSSLVQEKGGVA
ncbi:g-patch domain-containing protein [Ditylenchus destructor]|uniref:G-patch domain-containing protein n=1 Tax=Ditylenchus destructor TaxID=166010 RepID=A0AAD4R1T5_9BILA|nr:g-patch domain-containing protein [Ditylenchus destructor]